MDNQPRKRLTLIQIMLLVALVGILLTVAVSVWDGPGGADSPGIDEEMQEVPAGSQ
ncbi:MAG: hypothetical protein PVG24_03540 [Gammaproteobacteria bacterium]